MKDNKKLIFILILFLSIGFAAVTTSLFINGTIALGVNEEDLDIYFSEAIIDGVDKTNVFISEDGKTLNFTTTPLTKLGQQSILEYEVTNNSRNYDANVVISCTSSIQSSDSYVTLNNSLTDILIPTQTVVPGTITVTLEQSYVGEEDIEENYTCTLTASAIEKTQLADVTITTKEYYANAYLTKDDNTMIANTNLVIFSSNPTYVTTDDRGFFHASGLEGGDHEIYVVENKTIEELKLLTKEEIITLATYKGTFNTSQRGIDFDDTLIVEDADIGPGSPNTYNIELDVNGGTGENYNILVVEGKKLGKNFNPDHETMVFKGWYSGETKYTRETLVTNEIAQTLLASYTTGLAAIGDKQFKSIQAAIDYATLGQQTEIDVLETHSLYENIETDKNIILDLNQLTVDFSNYYLRNTGTMTIDNGVIKASGRYGIYNTGNIDLASNLVIHKDDIQYQGSYYTASALQNTSSGIATINGATFVGEYTTNLNRMIINNGNMTIEDGFFDLKGTSSGILINNGKTTINAGTFESLNADGNVINNPSGSELYIGSSGKTVTMKGQGKTLAFLISNFGDFYIPDGNIESEDCWFIGNLGNLVVGTETTIPTITSYSDKIPIEVQKGTATFKNGNIISYGNSALSVTGGNAVNENATFTSYKTETNSDRTIKVFNDGIFTMNGGTILGTENGAGLIRVFDGGLAYLNGGNLDNTNTTSSGIYIDEESTMYIGKENMEVNILGNAASTYFFTTADGVLNFSGGEINITDVSFCSAAGTINYGPNGENTIINNDSGELFDLRTNGAINIYNGIINNTGTRVIDAIDNTHVNIYGGTINHETESTIPRAITSSGKVVVDGGELIAKGATYGIIQINEGSDLTINGGKFDNSLSSDVGIYTRADTITNIGKKNKDIEFVNSLNTAIVNNGIMNVRDGNISSINGNFLKSKGEVNVSDANITGSNGFIFTVEAGSLLNINSGNILLNSNTKIDRIINVTGTLNFNGGNLESRGISYGAISAFEGSITNLRSGTIKSDNADAVMIYSSETADINIGGENQHIEFYGNVNNYLISTLGKLDVLGGYVKVDNGYLLGVSHIGTIHGGTIEITNGGLARITSTGYLTINGGTITAVNDRSDRTSRMIVNNGSLIMNDGSLKASGTSYGTLQANSGSSSLLNGGMLDGEAAASNNIYAQQSSVIDIGSEGKIFEIKNSNTIGLYSAGVVHIAAGTFKASGGFAFGIDGTMEVSGGNFDIDDASFLYVRPSGTVNVTGGTFNYYTSAITNRMFTNEGILNISAGTHTVSGATSGFLTTSAGSTTTITGGEYDNSGASGTFAYISADSNITLGSESGTITITGTSGYSAFYVIGELEYVGGTMNFNNGNLFQGVNYVNINKGTFNLNEASLVAVSSGTIDITTANVTATSTTRTARILNATGTLNIKGGTYNVSGALSGAITIDEGGTGNITGGTFNGTSSSGTLVYVSQSGTLNVGSSTNTITFNGNLQYYNLFNAGTTNITEGTINSQSTALYGGGGTLTVGSTSKSVNINNPVGQRPFTISSGGVGTIYNTTTSATDTRIATINSGGTLNVHSGTYSISYAASKDRIFYCAGTLNVYGGTYTVNANMNGLLTLAAGGVASLHGGTFTGSGIAGNFTQVAETATLNIGTSANTYQLTMSVTNSGSNPLCAQFGTLNVYSGTLTNDSAYGIIMSNGYPSTITNIYGGNITTTGTKATIYNGEGTLLIAGGTIKGSANPTVYNYAGTMNMTGGTVLQTASNYYALYNAQGTATKTGGTASPNYNVS